MRTVVDLDALNSLAQRMTNKYRRINWGGCAVISYLIHEKLLGSAENLRTIFFSSEYSNRPSIEEIAARNSNMTLKVLNKNDYYCDHAIVLFDIDGETYAFDTDLGAMPFERYKRKTNWCDTFYEVPLEINRQVAEEEEGWNEVFDRTQIPRMKIAIKNSRLVREVA